MNGSHTNDPIYYRLMEDWLLSELPFGESFSTGPLLHKFDSMNTFYIVFFVLSKLPFHDNYILHARHAHHTRLH